MPQAGRRGRERCMDGHRTGGMAQRVRGSLRRAVGRSRQVKTSLSRLARRTLRIDPVPIEIVLDGGGLLNWRCVDKDVAALVLSPTGHGPEVLSVRSDRPGPPNGCVEVRTFSVDAYRLAVVGSRGRRHPVAVLGDLQGETRNEAWSANGSRWRLRSQAGAETRLVREDPSRRTAAVQEINAVLGVVSISVGPLAEGVLTLRRRGAADVIEIPTLGPTGIGGSTFRIGAADFPGDLLDPADGTTVWDVGVRGPDVEVAHLRWGGSGLLEPRKALRLRRSVSYLTSGAAAVSLRPYWNTGQRLSVEARALSPMKGTAP